MQRTRMLICALLLLLTATSLYSQTGTAEPAQRESPVTTKPAPEKPTANSSSFDLNAIDRNIDPCVNFYQFACGNWMANNPIPPDQSRWGRSTGLLERNLEILHDILEKAAAPSKSRTVNTRKIGDYYSSCMDEALIEKKGMTALKAPLDRIAAIKSLADLPELIGHMHQHGFGPFFSWDSGQDFKDATQVIAQADQGGIGLPDRDYYIKDDPKSVEIRKDYVAHVQRMFQLAGEPQEKAATDAQIVMNIETALAKVSLDLVSRRDPEKQYHKMTLGEMQQLAPQFSFTKYFAGGEIPPVDSINVAWPDFFKGMNDVVKSTPLDEIKTYLRWHVIHGQASFLPKAFVDENFAFFGKELTGATELKPRWKRCVEATDGDLGFALGQPYVERTFGKEGKERALKMVEAIEKALGQDISTLSWMTPETRKQALVKLEAVRNKIGYPDKWRDYSKLSIIRGDALGNSLRANAFDFNRRMAKIGKPVDRGEWGMTPPTVNAYYYPPMNDINFPAGILQPPFYSNQIDDPVNFGGIGAVIGHELTHGFDDEGRQFDAQGNLRDWWTEADAKAFAERAQCVVDEYSNFVATGDVKLNGKLTLGENLADNGGVRVALMALLNTLGDKQPGNIDGFTPEQRFFLGYGQIWCQNVRPEAARMRAAVDPHSPGQYRVNGVVQNMPEFQKAWGCKAGQPMVPENACRVW